MKSSIEGELLSQREAAAEIGVTYETLGRWLSRGWVSVGRTLGQCGELFHAGPPPMVKVGGSWVGLRDEILAWSDEWRKR